MDNLSFSEAVNTEVLNANTATNGYSAERSAIGFVIHPIRMFFTPFSSSSKQNK